MVINWASVALLRSSLMQAAAWLVLLVVAVGAAALSALVGDGSPSMIRVVAVASVVAMVGALPPTSLVAVAAGTGATVAVGAAVSQPISPMLRTKAAVISTRRSFG